MNNNLNQHGEIIEKKFIDGSLFDSESYWLYLYEDGEVVKEFV